MGIVKTGKIQTMGEPLGELYVKSLWFEQINSGTSGTLAPPAQAEIVLDQWSAGIDALASTIASGIPAFISPVTSGGVIITATLDSSGNWTLSGTPSAYPVAIVYAYQVKFRFFDYTKQLGGFELIPAAGGVFTDIANFGGKLSSVDTTVQKALDTLDDHGHTQLHDSITLKTGHDVALSLLGQELDLADVLTPTEHTAIGDNSPHHAALTVGADGEHSLAAQVLSGVDAAATQKGHIKLAGELTGTAALPTIISIHSGSAHHAAVTVTGPISLSSQEVGLKNDAAAPITEVDTGALANLDTAVPTSKAVTTALAAKLDTPSFSLFEKGWGDVLIPADGLIFIHLGGLWEEDSDGNLKPKASPDASTDTFFTLNGTDDVQPSA